MGTESETSPTLTPEQVVGIFSDVNVLIRSLREKIHDVDTLRKAAEMNVTMDIGAYSRKRLLEWVAKNVQADAHFHRVVSGEEQINTTCSQAEFRKKLPYFKEFEKYVRQCCPGEVMCSINDNGYDANAIAQINGARVTFTITVHTMFQDPSFQYKLSWGYNPGGYRAFDDTKMPPKEAIPKLADVHHSYGNMMIVQTSFPGER